MTKILVTGGLGYIGSHTVVELQNHGFDPIIIDNLSNSNISVLEGIKKITGKLPIFYKLDITDENELSEFMSAHSDLKLVVHFAAFKSVKESVNFPLSYYHNNVVGLINLLRQMQKHEINNLVFSSSCTVYGESAILPVTEDTPFKPASSPYGNTKKICEDIIIDFCKIAPDFKAILLRYFNPIGAHPSLEIGELPLGVPNNLLPYLMQTAVGKHDYLSIFGNDYNTPDGTCIRDYIDIVDLAQAHVAASSHLLSGAMSANYDVFNIGTGFGLSVLDIVKSFERVAKTELKYRFCDRREGDVEQIWSDSTKAKQVLKWSAKTNIDDTIRTAWSWELKQLMEIK